MSDLGNASTMKVKFKNSHAGITIRMRVTELPAGSQLGVTVNMRVKPAVADFTNDTDKTQEADARLRIIPIDVPFSDAFKTVSNGLVKGKVPSFFDIDRELKTVLNFGGDYQSLLTAWKSDPTRPGGIIAKLYRPLPGEVEPRTQLWIDREIAKPLIDRLFTVWVPDASTQLYLRPPNRSIALTNQNGATIDNITMASLFTTGALNQLRPGTALNEWYTDDFNSAELNIDYSDYKNFIFYSSAQSRLQAFATKLLNIEDIDRVISLNSGSLTGFLNSGSLSYASLIRLADEKVRLLKSFDGYERFLFYKTGIPYSASHVTNDYQDQIFYHADATWPKISGSIATVAYASASLWYGAQMAIAENYDRHNQDYLGNNVPFYLKNDPQSQEFIKFFDLVGHQFDVVKSYVDQMPNMYNRDSDPLQGLSQDLVWNIAEANGVSLPNPYAIKTLVDYTVGSGSVDPKVYRTAAVETWKRFLHNQIYMMKTKGTKASLQALVNSYGILPTVLRIRESATPGVSYPTGTFEVYEEQTNVLRFNTGSYVSIPWSTISPKTVELRFAPVAVTQSVLFNVGTSWALRATPLTGSWGRLEITDGTVRVSSSYLPIYDGNVYSAMVNYNAGGVQLYVKRAEQNDLVYNSYSQESGTNIAANWTNGTTLYLGASGSQFGNDFAGTIDEFRVWNEVLSESIFDLHVKYPGLYNGNNTLAARNNLVVRLSFNIPQNLGGTNKVLPNESPYIRSGSVPAALLGFSGSAFTNVPTSPNNMELQTREVLRYTPNAGSQFSTNKVVIAKPPILQTVSNGSGSVIPILHHDRSIVTLDTKKGNTQSTNTIGFYFSLTDTINDSMIRSIGNFDLQNLIGDPADQFNARYGGLEVLNDIYWNSYAYTYNINNFVGFVKNLLGPLFTQAKDLIPARAKLLTGIVHEPHILERNKLKNRPLNVSAGKYGRDTETQNLEGNLGDVEPLYDAEYPVYDADVGSSDDYGATAEYDNYEARIDHNDHFMFLANDETFLTNISVITNSFVTASFISLDDDTNRLAFLKNLLDSYGVNSFFELNPSDQNVVTSQLAKYKSPGSIFVHSQYLDPAASAANNVAPSASYMVNTILPQNDLDRLEAYNYFDSPNGLIGIAGFNQVRTNANIIISRGNWTYGTTYVRNDYVLYSGSIEFVCITTDTPFISYIDPKFDPGNWKPMSYTVTTSVQPRVAILISGSVSIAPVTSTEPKVVGYHPDHYKFYRDRRRGILNHQFLGCLNDINTTIDGLSPVEVTDTAGGPLFVNNGSTPIVPSDNTAGPILDVK